VAATRLSLQSTLQWRRTPAPQHPLVTRRRRRHLLLASTISLHPRDTSPHAVPTTPDIHRPSSSQVLSVCLSVCLSVYHITSPAGYQPTRSADYTGHSQTFQFPGTVRLSVCLSLRLSIISLHPLDISPHAVPTIPDIHRPSSSQVLSVCPSVCLSYHFTRGIPAHTQCRLHRTFTDLPVPRYCLSVRPSVRLSVISLHPRDTSPHTVPTTLDIHRPSSSQVLSISLSVCLSVRLSVRFFTSRMLLLSVVKPTELEIQTTIVCFM